MADKQRRKASRQAQIDASGKWAVSIVNGQPSVAGLKVIELI